MVGYAVSIVPEKPAWLEALLNNKFFVACSRHLELKKNENNIFCVDCSRSICQHCLLRHRSHRLLQVRRYVYHDVIRLQDMQKLLECSFVQTYIINSARVVFLNQRPQSRPSKGLTNSCETCERGLQESYRYCSIACKVDAVMNKGNKISTLLHSCKSLPFPDVFDCSIDGPKLDVEEFSLLNGNLSNSLTTTTSSESELGVFASTATTIRKIRTNRSGIATKSLISPPKRRRKGVPRRSPIY